MSDAETTLRDVLWSWADVVLFSIPLAIYYSQPGEAFIRLSQNAIEALILDPFGVFATAAVEVAPPGTKAFVASAVTVFTMAVVALVVITGVILCAFYLMLFVMNILHAVKDTRDYVSPSR